MDQERSFCFDKTIIDNTICVFVGVFVCFFSSTAELYCKEIRSIKTLETRTRMFYLLTKGYIGLTC